MYYLIFDPSTGQGVAKGSASGLPQMEGMATIEITRAEYESIPQSTRARVSGGALVQADAADLLAQGKADQWEKVKAARNAAEFGPFIWNGKTFDGDAESQRRLAAAAQLANLAGEGFLVTWTLATNEPYVLNAVMLSSLMAKLATDIAAIYDRGRALRVQIEAAATLEAVAAVEW